MESYLNIMNRHSNRETEGFQGFFVFKDDEKPGIRKEYIDDKRKSEVQGHTYTDAHEIIFSKNTQEKEVKRDDREKFEKCQRVPEFEKREEIQKSTGNPISDTSFVVDYISTSFLPACYERDESSFRDRRQEYMKEDTDNERCDKLPKIRSVHPLNDESKKLILQFEYINIGKGELIEDDTTQIYGRQERGKEIEFLEEGGGHNEFPGWSDDRFSQEMFFFWHMMSRLRYRGVCLGMMLATRNMRGSFIMWHMRMFAYFHNLLFGKRCMVLNPLRK